MSKASALPYKLRPNKAVDRELFLDLLTRLAATLELRHYEYIGLGGPFLEDFRLIHSRVGIDKMVCVETDENVHKRQLFNRPVASIDCVHDTLEDYLDSRDFDHPVIIWFDYTDPLKLTTQIERFCRTFGEVPAGSILRITLNSNPTSLGNPDADEVSGSKSTKGPKGKRNPTVQEWRLEKFRKRLGNMFPAGLQSSGMTYKKFGQSVLSALGVALAREELNHKDREASWTLATHYADGQPMVTATLVVADKGELGFRSLLADWQFASSLGNPLMLDLPPLSSIERHTMESTAEPEKVMGYSLPKSDMGGDPYTSFKQFYRMFPQFARVEL